MRKPLTAVHDFGTKISERTPHEEHNSITIRTSQHSTLAYVYRTSAASDKNFFCSSNSRAFAERLLRIVQQLNASHTHIHMYMRGVH